MKKHNKDQLTVVKHNDLNQASYRLTLNERRLILSSIAQLNSSLSAQEQSMKFIRVHARDFASEWDLDLKSSYAQLKQARDNLFERKISLREGNKGVDFRWISAAKYADGDGFIEVAFSPTIIPFLTELKSHFTTFRLMEVKRFKSGHSIRLYELLMQFKATGWLEESVDDLKAMFGVEDKYHAWYEFRRWVIEPAVKEINQISSFTVAYEPRRRGRRIGKLIFKFKEKRQRRLFD